MFALVCDIKSYPEFVPLCQSIVVESEREDKNKHLIIATMTMSYGLLSESFRTRVLMDKDTLEVDVRYVDGPFKHLENKWKFLETGETECEVSFLIDYELRSQLLSMAASAVFETAFSQFSSAFERRADEVYGKST